jgi:hypothetical protein
MKARDPLLRRLAIAVVVIHFVLGMVHGAAHSNLHIGLNLWQNIFVLLVITLLPLLSAVLIWRGWGGGFMLLFCSMLGSLIFGIYFHFIASGSDNAMTVVTNSTGHTFQVTAALLTVIEAAGVVIGFLGIRKSK